MLDALVKQQPQNIRVHLDRGKSLEKLNRYEEAVDAFQSAIRIDADRAEAHYQLARVYQKLNRPAEFRRELEIAQKLQRQKLQRQESLLEASGTHGDPTQGMGVTPARE